MSSRRDKVVTFAWIAFWGTLSTAWCWTSAYVLGVTFDEPFYLERGLLFWKHVTHGYLLEAGTMPLPAEAQTLPLVVVKRCFGIQPLQDFATWLPVARMMTAGFWWLLLWAVYRLGSQAGGIVAGRLAVALLACEPIFLGHAGLATADVPFTACLLMLIAAFQRNRDEATWKRRLLMPAVWFALTFLAKATALLFVPVCLGMVELERLIRGGWRPGWSRESWKPALASVRDLLVLALLGCAMTIAVCPRAPSAYLFQIQHNVNGHGAAFLLGESRLGGFWYYFPVALTIKLGLPVLLLLVLLLAIRPRDLLMNAPTWAALGLLALTPTFRVQIGVRFVLPIAAFAMVAAAIALGRWWNESPSAWGRVRVGGLAAAAILWSALGAATVWPHGICFTNELWGGTANGYRLLADSNYDWGQGLPELAAWQRRHTDVPLRVLYFGTDPAESRLPHQSLLLDGVTSPAELAKANAGRFVAVTTNACVAGPVADLFRPFQPCDRTMTYLIFDFRRGPDGVAQR